MINKRNACAMWVVSLALLYLRPCFVLVREFWNFPPFMRCGQLTSTFPAMGSLFLSGPDILSNANG
jgi:hypothetical protein